MKEVLYEGEVIYQSNSSIEKGRQQILNMKHQTLLLQKFCNQ